MKMVIDLIYFILVVLHEVMKWLFEMETCDSNWLRSRNISNLSDILHKELFGQPFVKTILLKVIGTYLSSGQQKKALVLSFHGCTGTGKTHVAKLLAKFLYEKGSTSEFVHWKDATVNYQLSDNLDYHRDLQEFIVKNTKACKKSLFIFDEFDKMPVGLTNVLKPYLESHVDIEGIDYRNNIFLLLNNHAGNMINNIILKTIESNGKQVSTNTFDFNELNYSLFPITNLIDYCVPFLPLQRSHVKQCVAMEIKKYGQYLNEDKTKKLTEQVANEMQYNGIFSETGCKMVLKKLDIFL